MHSSFLNLSWDRFLGGYFAAIRAFLILADLMYLWRNLAFKGRVTTLFPNPAQHFPILEKPRGVRKKRPGFCEKSSQDSIPVADGESLLLLGPARREPQAIDSFASVVDRNPPRLWAVRLSSSTPRLRALVFLPSPRCSRVRQRNKTRFLTSSFASRCTTWGLVSVASVSWSWSKLVASWSRSCFPMVSCERSSGFAFWGESGPFDWRFSSRKRGTQEGKCCCAAQLPFCCREGAVDTTAHDGRQGESRWLFGRGRFGEFVSRGVGSEEVPEEGPFGAPYALSRWDNKKRVDVTAVPLLDWSMPRSDVGRVRARKRDWNP